MRLDLFEISVLESPQIESGQQRNDKEYRNADLELCDQSLPEYTRVSEVSEPHPVGNESDHHCKKRKDDGNDHYDKRQTLAASLSLSYKLAIVSSGSRSSFRFFTVCKLCQSFVLPARSLYGINENNCSDSVGCRCKSGFFFTCCLEQEFYSRRYKVEP